MTLKEYLKNPCLKLSIPYWKSKTITMPENVKIVHQNDFCSEFLNEYSDERYFRLIHYLKNINSEIPYGFSVKTAELTDIPMIVEIIYNSYTDLSVSCDQIISYTKTQVYNENLGF